MGGPPRDGFGVSPHHGSIEGGAPDDRGHIRHGRAPRPHRVARRQPHGGRRAAPRPDPPRPAPDRARRPGWGARGQGGGPPGDRLRAQGLAEPALAAGIEGPRPTTARAGTAASASHRPSRLPHLRTESSPLGRRHPGGSRADDPRRDPRDDSPGWLRGGSRQLREDARRRDALRGAKGPRGPGPPGDVPGGRAMAAPRPAPSTAPADPVGSDHRVGPVRVALIRPGS